ncbi:MAG: hypothetical protein U0936_02890 [Planctomycetaceae bacterium]
MSRPESARAVAASFLNSQAFRSVFVILGWLGSFCICMRFEWSRLQVAISSPAGALGWFTDWNSDTTLPFIVLLFFPAIVFSGARGFRRGVLWQSLSRSVVAADAAGISGGPKRHLLTTSGLFLISFLCSASIGWREIPASSVTVRSGHGNTVRFARLPPAYHDEFSYLLQARTFLAGRLSWPPMTVRPDLFHQIHVLNEPTTASRYFPWTGVWLAPFVACDTPWLGQWIAGALSCAFFFRSLLRLLPFRSAVVGGLLIAVSPGLAVFSNLLLAHHATMLALSVFLWAFLRLMGHGRTFDAFLAGGFLTLAMLGRPMTAAGFALPFGVWFLIQLLRRRVHNAISELKTTLTLNHVLAMGGPILIGFLVLIVMNQSITGSWNRSAYQYYTDTWTPSHRFGFNNAEIGQAAAGPKILKAYDRWATNLTLRKSMENVEHRTIASSQWSLGIIAIMYTIFCALPSCCRWSGGDLRIGLLSLSIITLHLVHIPYWYDGIMHWHYVFETAPLLLMLAAVGLRNSLEVMRALKMQAPMRMWLLALIGACLLPGWVNADSFWGPSRVSQAVSEQAFSRVRFELFNQLVRSSAVQHPCLILVDERNSDPQLSYIVNPPDMTGDVLVCRHPEDEAEIMELSSAFPERSVYVFDPETFQLTRFADSAPNSVEPAAAKKEALP